MIVVIDNYDSFVSNLARYVEILGHQVTILRNDKTSVDEIVELAPSAIILSPGPCAPQDAGICKELIRALGANIPILGVCLGHQAIGEVYGGYTITAPEPVHGKSSAINHKAQGIFNHLPMPFQAGRYHSLMTVLPNESDLIVTATTEDGVIMGIEHIEYPIYGVQFHPESILTEHGGQLIQNFLDIAKSWSTIRTLNMLQNANPEMSSSEEQESAA